MERIMLCARVPVNEDLWRLHAPSPECPSTSSGWRPDVAAAGIACDESRSIRSTWSRPVPPARTGRDLSDMT